MSQAGSNAIFDFLQICRHGVKLVFGIIPPTNPQAPAGSRPPAVYVRIQAASPPPRRADGSEWTYGMLNDGLALPPSPPPGGWEKPAERFADDIASLGQPPPDTIKLDQWLTVPADPGKRMFTDEPAPLGFLSARYPQPVLGADGVAYVEVEYNIATDEPLPWSNPSDPPKPGSWVVFSFDRFWPPERESVEFIGQVQADCDCDDPNAAGQEQAAQVRSGSA
jgi:hypothetical protein